MTRLLRPYLLSTTLAWAASWAVAAEPRSVPDGELQKAAQAA